MNCSRIIHINHPKLVSPFAVLLFLIAPSYSQSHGSSETTGQGSNAVLISDVNWGPLNAARGDASPRAGTLWGDRKGRGATGFLVRFSDGFSSPPHIHNVTYRGVVISGMVHNDDPDAETMWLPPGSYWTQPAGDVHITSAKGKDVMAYIEIEDGPYLVKPTGEAFKTKEAEINVDPSNHVWLGASDLTWIEPNHSDKSKNPELSFLWGTLEENEMNGSLLRLPPGYSGEVESEGLIRFVVVQGAISYGKDRKVLKSGSYFSSEGKAIHRIANNSSSDGLIYVRSKGLYKVK